MREVAPTATPSASGSAPTLAEAASLSTAGQSLTGQRVCIHGVQTRTELNGTYGRAIAFHAERGRYAVELEGSREHAQTCSGGWPGVCQIAQRSVHLGSGSPNSKHRRREPSQAYSYSCASLDL